eukprot:COSAG02_NODE_44184_length_368_cov_0.910781_1_plen_30_part_10
MIDADSVVQTAAGAAQPTGPNHLDGTARFS